MRVRPSPTRRHTGTFGCAQLPAHSPVAGSRWVHTTLLLYRTHAAAHIRWVTYHTNDTAHVCGDCVTCATQVAELIGLQPLECERPEFGLVMAGAWLRCALCTHCCSSAPMTSLLARIFQILLDPRLVPPVRLPMMWHHKKQKPQAANITWLAVGCRLCPGPGPGPANTSAHPSGCCLSPFPQALRGCLVPSPTRSATVRACSWVQGCRLRVVAVGIRSAAGPPHTPRQCAACADRLNRHARCTHGLAVLPLYCWGYC